MGCSGASPTPTPPRDAAVALAPAANLFVAAVEAKDWAAAAGAIQRRHVELAGAPFDAKVVAALDTAWEPLAAWLASQTTITGAYFTLARVTDSLPAYGERLAALATRAATEQAELGRAAHGPGGAWLHAALRAKLSGDRAAREAADAALARAVRPDFDIFPFPRSCNWIASPPRVPGRPVSVATSGLSCQIADERRWDTSDPYGYVEGGVTRMGTRTTHHRVVVARIAGNVTLRWDGGEREVAIAIDGGVDEIAFATPQGTQGFSPVKAEQARPEASRRLHAELATAVLEVWTPAALTAGKAALGRDVAIAEDQLAIHARLASPSPELGTVLARYGVAIGELF